MRYFQNSSLPKISIITPSFNKGNYLKRTIESVLAQNYPNLEYLIVDGGSKDETIKILESFGKKIKWISERDYGQVDAINKGIKRTNGEIIGYLNADDIYEKGALFTVAKTFLENKDSLWFAGQGKIINDQNKEISSWVSKYKNFLLLLNNYQFLLMVNYFFQPAVFITRKAYQKYGPFKGTEGIVMEYDLWLKLGKVRMPVVINSKLANFRLSLKGFSLNSSDRILKEDFEIVKKNTKNIGILFLHLLHNWARILVTFKK